MSEQGPLCFAEDKVAKVKAVTYTELHLPGVVSLSGEALAQVVCVRAGASLFCYR